MGSLSLRPGDSLTVPRTALSVGFIRFVSSTNATQATGFRLFPRWDSPPTEHASLSLVAQWLKKYATFDVTINSVLGSAIAQPEDAYAIAVRARALGFNSTVGVVHDGGGQLKPLSGTQAGIY